jgi:hypothetical protein
MAPGLPKPKAAGSIRSTDDEEPALASAASTEAGGSAKRHRHPIRDVTGARRKVGMGFMEWGGTRQRSSGAVEYGRTAVTGEHECAKAANPATGAFHHS